MEIEIKELKGDKVIVETKDGKVRFLPSLPRLALNKIIETNYNNNMRLYAHVLITPDIDSEGR